MIERWATFDCYGTLPPAEEDALAVSLPTWPVFQEVPQALRMDGEPTRELPDLTDLAGILDELVGEPV